MATDARYFEAEFFDRIVWPIFFDGTSQFRANTWKSFQLRHGGCIHVNGGFSFFFR